MPEEALQVLLPSIQVNGIDLRRRKLTPEWNDYLAKARTDWIKNNINNPSVLFGNKYSRTRDKLSDSDWDYIYSKHPEYFDPAGKYRKQVPDKYLSRQFNKGIRDATGKAAGEFLPYILGATTNPLLPLLGVTTLMATDEFTNSASRGKYNTLANYVSDKTGSKVVGNIVGILPSALATGLAAKGTYTPSYTRNARLIERDPALVKEAILGVNANIAKYKPKLNINLNLVNPEHSTQYLEPVRQFDNPSLAFFERPSKLSSEEKLGIPKGERNNIQYRPHNYGNLYFIKNYDGIPLMENGKVRISPSDNVFANVTTDVPFRLHPSYSIMPGSEYMIIDPKALKGYTPLSIEPSDTFFPNENLLIDPEYIRILTGNSELIPKLKSNGFKVITSPKLQEIYKKVMSHPPGPAVKGIDATGIGVRDNDLYRAAIDEFITLQIGRPSLKDYTHLEKMTGLKAGVELNTGQLKQYLDNFDKVNHISLKNTTDQPMFIYPNNKLLGIEHFIEYDGRRVIPYQNVFYDPVTEAESNIVTQLGGMSPAPKFSRYAREEVGKIINNYILKHGIRPLRKKGGKLNYFKFFK